MIIRHTIWEEFTNAVHKCSITIKLNQVITAIYVLRNKLKKNGLKQIER